jgi:UDP-glucose 4-epimerase
MRYLVTGGAGFIGSALVRGLLAEGAGVRVLDNFSTGHRANLAGVDGVEIVAGDLREPEVARDACREVEVVFHEAAIPSVPKSVRDPWQSHSHNLDATVRLLIAARDQGVRRVVYAASSSVYGNTAAGAIAEAAPPAPLSPYAVAKYSGELYARVFADLYPLETISLRYFNVYGPRQDPNSPYSGVISRFLAALLGGQAPIVYGDGQQSRDFVFVADVVRANLLARHRGASGSVYNVGTGRRRTLLEVIEILGAILGERPTPRFEPARAGDIRDSLADVRRIQQELGYRAEVGVEEGLSLTLEWLRTQRSTAA